MQKVKKLRKKGATRASNMGIIKHCPAASKFMRNVAIIWEKRRKAPKRIIRPTIFAN